MVWRFLLRYFANNEQLVERLSQSNLMRRAAQLTVYTLLKWRAILGQKSLTEAWKPPRNVSSSSSGGCRVDHDQQFYNGQSPFDRLQSLSKRISQEMKAGVKEFQDELKRRGKP